MMYPGQYRSPPLLMERRQAASGYKKEGQRDLELHVHGFTLIHIVTGV